MFQRKLTPSAGFVFFVASLQAGHYKFQFTNFAWTHMALYLIVVQAHFVMNNVFEGMIWFFLPAALVITNDIFAYICGIAFGRTQLIKLSPKKTVEGFVGAWIATVLFGMVLVNLMIRSKYFICPVNVRKDPPGASCPVVGIFTHAHESVGPRSHHFHRAQMRTESRLHSSHVLHAGAFLFAGKLQEFLIDVCPDAASRVRVGDICVFDCSIWRLLRFGAEAQLQD